MSYFADVLGFLGFSTSAKCFFACFKTFGWKTCAASSSVVISFGCFFVLGMVIL